MATPGQKKTEARIEARRAATAELARAGLTYREILVRLKAGGHRSSLGTIGNDLEALTERYRQESFKSREESLLLDLDRLDAIIATIWESALDGVAVAIDRVLRIIDQRSRMLDYPSIPMKDTATTAAAESDLTADEEALLMLVLHAMRDGRALGPVVDEAYLQLPASLDDPTPLPPGYPTDGK